MVRHSKLSVVLFASSLFGAFSVNAAPTAIPTAGGYQGQSVISCQVTQQSQVEALLKLDTVDVWSHGAAIGKTVDVRVRTPEERNAIEGIFGQCKTWIADLQQLVQQETNAISQRSANVADDGDFHNTYHNYAEIVGKLQAWSTAFPQLARFVPSIGKTHEGREIPAIHLTSSNSTATKKKIWFNGGIHAREWISSATVLYVIDQLLGKYGSDADVTNILDNVEFVITPLCNPDGFEYTRTDRMWRKNRRNNGGTYGVDLNRNFPFKWGGSGSSGTPSSETYRGPSAGSEPETQALVAYVTKQGIAAGIDFHSYSQLVLRSWGYTNSESPREAQLKEIGDGISSVIQQQSGKSYQSMRSSELYLTDGDAADWIDGGLGALGYTIELRPEQSGFNNGFILEPSEIRPTGEEQFAVVKYFAGKVLGKA